MVTFVVISLPLYLKNINAVLGSDFWGNYRHQVTKYFNRHLPKEGTFSVVLIAYGKGGHSQVSLECTVLCLRLYLPHTPQDVSGVLYIARFLGVAYDKSCMVNSRSLPYNVWGMAALYHISLKNSYFLKSASILR